MPTQNPATLNKTPNLVAPQGDFAKKVKDWLLCIKKDRPKLYPLFFRLFANKATPRQAIKAKCLDCSGFQHSEITSCRITTCPLWNYRPYQKSEGE